MARILFQIGDFPVFNHYLATAVAGVTVDEPVTWRIASTVLTDVSGQYVSGAFERPLMAVKNYRTTGSFQTEKGMTKDQKVAKLMSLGGRPGIPIIAFEYDDCGHDGLTCGCNPSLNWVVALGTITNVARKTDVVLQDQLHAGEFTMMDVDISMQTPWRRLSPWVWEFRNVPINNPFSQNNSSGLSGNTFVHPKKVASLAQQGFFYKWADDLIKYSPDYWAIKYSEGIDGGFGINYSTVPYQNDLIAPEETWNASPSVMYAITNLQTSGTVRIRTTYQTGLFFGEYASQDSDLDLALVNTALLSLGYGVLRSDDIIITGRVAPFPSFVIRDTQIIPDFVPKWNYEGTYPGEIYALANRIEFYNSGANARYAYLVEYGAY